MSSCSQCGRKQGCCASCHGLSPCGCELDPGFSGHRPLPLPPTQPREPDELCPQCGELYRSYDRLPLAPAREPYWPRSSMPDDADEWGGQDRFRRG